MDTLNRNSYIQIIEEIRNLEKDTLDLYIDKKLSQYQKENPTFYKTLYKDILYVLDIKNQNNENGLVIENGDLVIENGDIKLSGYYPNLSSLSSWLHLEVMKQILDGVKDLSLIPEKLEEFEANFLFKKTYTPSYQSKLDELKDKIQSEKHQNFGQQEIDIIKRPKRAKKSSKHSDIKIFISHSSKDKNIIDFFVEKILLLGCGLSDNQIFCTSIEGLGIKTGEDFRTHIKDKLNGSTHSLIMISENYRRSEVCLNEFGASWVVDDLQVWQFLFPNLSYNNLGFLLNTQQGAMLNDPSALDGIYEDLAPTSISRLVTRWNKHKLSFLEILENSSTTRSIYPSPDEYFENFIAKDISLNRLFLMAHPTLLDCKQIFSEKHYKSIFQSYCHYFEEITERNMTPLSVSYDAFRFKKSSVQEIRMGKNKLAGGMATATANGLFKYDIEFYSVTFLKNQDSDSGLNYSVFCYVNDRWVFIPKPWRFYNHDK